MSYDTYQEMKREYHLNNKHLIEIVNKDTPQNILMAKTVWCKLEDDKAKATTLNNEFGFTERLVNKLMHFAYLKGSSDIEQRSYDRGYEQARQDILEKIGEL
jgi:hypothetical protein